MKPPGRLIDIGGRRLHVREAGDRLPVVVFDAALGASSISWLFVQPRVSEFARTFAYDRAGFAWSDAGPMPRTAGRIADELHVLLARAGEPPPYVLVGHSYGGLVMRIFASRYRAEVAGMVLVDPAHPEDWITPAPNEQKKIDRGVRLCRTGRIASKLGLARLVSELVGFGAIGPARGLVDRISRGEVGGDIDWLLAPLWKIPPEARRPLRSHWTKAKFYEALGSQIATISDSAREALEAARGGYGDIPLVTISMADPGDHRLRQQEALARLSTRGRHVVASRSGHWIPLDEPDLVINEIRRVHGQASPAAASPVRSAS
jgi:pimeloyl-ACP methyl ester carboxylesterase